jgi:hypothetical protein
MDQADVTDLYQAAYLILRGCTLQGIECIPTGGSLSCRMRFSGTELSRLQDDYFTHEAVVNLYAFRSAYNQVNSYVHQAKKSYDLRRREDHRPADGMRREAQS